MTRRMRKFAGIAVIALLRITLSASSSEAGVGWWRTRVPEATPATMSGLLSSAVIWYQPLTVLF